MVLCFPPWPTAPILFTFLFSCWSWTASFTFCWPSTWTRCYLVRTRRNTKRRTLRQYNPLLIKFTLMLVFCISSAETVPPWDHLNLIWNLSFFYCHMWNQDPLSEMQESLEWGGPWCTSWNRPIGPNAEGAMLKWVQFMTQRWTEPLAGMNLLSPFHLSSEEKRPSGKNLNFHTNVLSLLHCWVCNCLVKFPVMMFFE